MKCFIFVVRNPKNEIVFSDINNIGVLPTAPRKGYSSFLGFRNRLVDVVFFL